MICLRLGIVLYLLAVFTPKFTLEQDPCLEGNFLELDYMTKRSRSYDVDSTPLCDMHIGEGWYVAKSHVMSMLPPTLGKCGALYPVWLNGHIPPDGDNVTLTACQVGFSNNCSKSYEIEVKNCGGFSLYKLKPLESCSSAYCFDLYENCVNETINNARVSFKNITWTRKENENNEVKYDPSVNLICSFTPADDDTLFYHIDWYVDNEMVIQGQTVDKKSLNDAILSAADLNKAGKKINSWVHCVIGMKTAKNEFPCFTKSSELFFAGIEILNPTVDIERKGNATIMMRPTIPFASETIQIENGNQFTSPLNVELSFTGNSEAKCQEGTSGSLKRCSVEIKGFTYKESQKYEDESNWYKTHPIEIFNSDAEGYYMPTHKLVLRLGTNKLEGEGARIFSGVDLHDVHINVIDKKEEWKGKCCTSTADPHQKTFDGFTYECQGTGCLTGKTYIFYRNEKHLQEVQVQHNPCWGRARCVCAVAARSGQDVFTIDVCNQRQFINFPICNENSLKVIKETDKIYKIIFPTGTSVKVSIFNYGSPYWYINLEVYPTVADVGNTIGLCGVLDGNKTNDLRRRDGTQDDIKSFSITNPPNTFSLSWQLPEGSSEDLLSMSQAVYDQLEPLSTSFYKLCTCDKEKTYCSYKQYTECKTMVKGKEYHCILHSSSSRRKRDLEYLTRRQENIPMNIENEGRVKRQAFNEVDAYDICNDAFQKSAYYGNCLQVVPNFSNESLVNCVTDLVITGNQNLTQLHLDTALGQCQTYIRLNSTLEREHPDVTTVIVNLCPNNCSNRGVCSSGNCTCEYGFGGSDCSFDVLSPPTITWLSGGGVCDKSSESCSDITLYGHYFLENMGTTCYVTRTEMNENDTVTSQTSYTVDLQERTLYEGYCNLEYGLESSYYTTYHFNLSNDGTQFSPLYTVYVYQSACQAFQNLSGDVNITLQQGHCYINGSCVQSGKYMSNESCWRCLPSSNAYDWTRDCKETDTTAIPVNGKSNKRNTQEEEGLSLTEKILIAANCIVTFFILAIGGYTCKQKCSNRNSDDHSTLVTSKEQNVNIYPDSDRPIATRGNFNPAELLQFDSPSAMYSRPSSATSERRLPPTNDFRQLYDDSHIDRLFCVKGN